MNTINLSEEKYSLFCFLVNEITSLRESIPLKTNNTRDYRSNPITCCKIVQIISYIHENITKNKTFLKKKIGTVYEYLTIWINLIAKKENTMNEEFLKLQKEKYILSILTKYESSYKKNNSLPDRSANREAEFATNPDFGSDEQQTEPSENTGTFISHACNKYITNEIQRKEINNEIFLHFNNRNLNHDFLLLKIGHLFPRYVLTKIFNNFYSINEFRKKLWKLEIPKYWTSEKLIERGKKLGEKSAYNRIKSSELSDAIYSFKVACQNFPQNVNSEEILIDIQTEKNENKSLSYFSIVKYCWYLINKIKVKKIIDVLGITYPVYYKIKKELFQTTVNTNQTNSKQNDFESFRQKIEQYESAISTHSPRIDKLIKILPSGDIQVIFKYGTPEHKKYLRTLNEKNIY